jgi:hypothetical protein
MQESLTYETLMHRVHAMRDFSYNCVYRKSRRPDPA